MNITRVPASCPAKRGRLGLIVSWVIPKT